jgi:hypothetical protein
MSKTYTQEQLFALLSNNNFAALAEVFAAQSDTTTETPKAPKPKKAPKGPTLAEGAADTIVKAGPDKGPSPRPLYELREDFATNEVKAAGSRKAYATAIGQTVGYQYWGEVPMSGEIGDNLKAVKDALGEERRALFALLKSRGHSNPSVHWARLRKDAMRPTGNGERHVKSISEVFKPTLEALYKRAWRDQSDFEGPADRAAFKALADTLVNVYGVRLATLQHKAENKTPATKAAPKKPAPKK